MAVARACAVRPLACCGVFDRVFGRGRSVNPRRLSPPVSYDSHLRPVLEWQIRGAGHAIHTQLLGTTEETGYKGRRVRPVRPLRNSLLEQDPALLVGGRRRSTKLLGQI